MSTSNISTSPSRRVDDPPLVLDLVALLLAPEAFSLLLLLIGFFVSDAFVEMAAASVATFELRVLRNFLGGECLVDSSSSISALEADGDGDGSGAARFFPFLSTVDSSGATVVGVDAVERRMLCKPRTDCQHE